MCGIIGVVGAQDALPILLEGLERLEYRGYDSAGVALVNAGVTWRARAAAGTESVASLVATCDSAPVHSPERSSWGLRARSHGRR